MSVSQATLAGGHTQHLGTVFFIPNVEAGEIDLKGY
jgi:hypothetical protein